ncbi:MAG: CmpA/NrtA family ABC transporter substrate-binding protein [Pontibacterium sp.]
MENALEKTHLKLGFIPLLDCAPLVVAREKGFFAKNGLDVVLVRESNWANIRDKVAFGLLDGAQMLSPLPLASTLGLGCKKVPMITGLTLSLNGNAITLAKHIFEEMAPQLRNDGKASPAEVGTAFKHWLEKQPHKPKIATVFPYSCHFYQLRYWLTAAGIDPDHDIDLVAISPVKMLETLKAGEIEGYCVGEPWNTLAELDGAGQIAVTGFQIWPDAIEKVFGVTEAWAKENPNTHKAVMKSLLEACHWLRQTDPETRKELMQLLALPPYLDESVLPFATLPDEHSIHQVFYSTQANAPEHSHAYLMLDQMERTGQWKEANRQSIVEQVYRTDIYQSILSAG